MQTPLNQPDPTSLPTEIKSPCLFNHRSGMAITSADFSSPMSPEPWQAETEATVGEESSREMIFLRFWATILNTYHSLSLAALYLLSPETQNFPSLSLVSRCMYHLFRFITALFLWMNIKTKIGMLALQKDLPKFQKPRFYLSNPLLSCRLCLEFVALLGVRRLHQRTHLDRLSWMYKGYVRTMVFALLLTWSGESRNWFYQRGVNPHHPPYFLKLRSVDSCSVYCRSQSLCGILDHHLHGREDPPDLSRSYTYSLHLLITSLVSSTAHNTIQSTSCSKLKHGFYLSISYRLHNVCGILDHHFHGREDPPLMIRIYTCCLRTLVLAPMMNSTSPKLLKSYGTAALMTQYRGGDFGLRGFSINNHPSTIPANCFKHRRLKQPNIFTSITTRTFVPQLLALALLPLVLFTQASFLALPTISTAQCLLTVTNLSSVELIDDDHSCNLDAACHGPSRK